MPAMSREIEEGLVERLDFDKLGKVAASGQALLPVAVQHADTLELLVVAYANRQTLERTLKDRVAVFWSSSRNELWIKGATSGDYLDIVDVRVNCEQNSLLYLVRPRGQGGCHTKGADGNSRMSCYYRSIIGPGELGWVQGMR